MFSRFSSRNASTLSTSDLLALIIMAQSMYPSSMELDDPGPEVENGPQLLTRHHHNMFLTISLIILTVFVCFASIKEGENTSGSGQESFYTPEPSPTDQDSSSSGA